MRIHLEREGPDCLAQLICSGPDFAVLSEHQYLDLGEGEAGVLGQVPAGGAKLLARVGVTMASRRKMLIKILDYRRLIYLW